MGWPTYTSPQGPFALKHPPNWETVEQNEVAVVFRMHEQQWLSINVVAAGAFAGVPTGQTPPFVATLVEAYHRDFPAGTSFGELAGGRWPGKVQAIYRHEVASSDDQPNGELLWAYGSVGAFDVHWYVLAKGEISLQDIQELDLALNSLRTK